MREPQRSLGRGLADASISGEVVRKRSIAALCVLGLAVAGGLWFFVASREEPTAIVVKDEEKRPVAGVEIKLDRDSVWTDSFDEPSFVGVTDADGRLELALEPDDEVLLAKPGFATDAFRIGRKRTTKLELTRSATLRGRVVSASTGAPIGDARVELVRYGGSEPSLFATSGADGHVTIEAIDPTLATDFVVQVHGCIPHQAELALREPRAYDHEFVIADAPRLRGRVIDLVTNEPIAAAEIVPLGMGGDIAYSAATTTDSTGAFELRGDLEAWYGVGFEARKEGYASTRRELDDEDTDWSEATELVLGVVRECVVEGTVTDERGEPVVGATVAASTNGSVEFVPTYVIPVGLVLDKYGVLLTHTDAQGRYRLRGVPAWQSLGMLAATTVGRAGQTVSGFERPGETRVVNWVLR
ncbi:MAG: carboxypeptidase regulatory-like domain-containing protein [Planctomycetes bacterium]|nr:carboxypeptidase regulatory-like domain-containing protein [Planctomycetota bacterium]MCC7170316.1 carboxypeptidase regulatory-like domain-containing protein [Planctomycetota bacterium]